MSLGIDQEEVDRLKTAPIDLDTERCIEEEVNKWKLEFEPRVESLEDDVLKMKGEMSCIQGSLSENWRTKLFRNFAAAFQKNCQRNACLVALKK